MPPLGEPYQQLSQLPEFQQLLDMVRSDNPLIALAVHKREVSWTKFQAWLLDPVRCNDGTPERFATALLEKFIPKSRRIVEGCTSTHESGTVHLQRFLRLDSVEVSTVTHAQAEVKEGKKGRCDLVVQCALTNTPVTILVENKIETEERKDQLADYVAEHLSKLPSGGILIPILMEWGDDPSGKTTCPWAICMDREDTDAWLSLGAEKSVSAGLTVPSCVEHYREVFRMRGLAIQIRQKARTAIEHLEQAKYTPAEWSLVQDWLRTGNTSFYEEVLRNARLKTVMEEHGLEVVRTAGRIRGQSRMLQISKSGWSISFPGAGVERVNVHFESRGPGHACLDVEIEPYESGIQKDPERMIALAPQLSAKAKLLAQIRMAVVGIQNPANSLGITTRGLRSPEKPSTCTAVRFDLGLRKNCTPEEHADLLASVLQRTHDTIETITSSPPGTRIE